MSLHDRIWRALEAAGKTPAMVRICLHPDDLERLDAEADPKAPAQSVRRTANGGRRFYGFLVEADPLAPIGAVVLRPGSSPPPPEID